MNKLIALLLAVLVFVGIVYADDITVTDENVVAEQTTTPEVSFSYIFPDNQDKNFAAGSVAEVLVGFTNKADKALNITHIYASLNHPQDSSVYIQNYTRGDFGIAVEKGHHATLAYRFVPSEYLEPRQFGLLISLEYQDGAQNYTLTFFNSTINITEKESSFDMDSFFLLILGFAVMGGVGYFVYSKMPKQKKVRRTVSKSSSVAKVETEADTADWLSGTSADKSKKSIKKNK
ncbi:hypothetical protein DICPUDRAFT_80780 [Dictyostelium purpureum]|uniref:Uncharacterized protein n=1 Tax=Dictyostelium purpureum TaxID=5786 RepID=F0ZRI4_DICPU|nr:uncharacterized protein DICPUDRAFT_80780 [Dictyostelium purpureum]EGC33447.1 hypothetical protein DICPUDRAFT_80780 [Dictyostelium purpureum]|eukprot:XP_003290018.1 hypothetical protein DICPUDRAFT_80780 [Dictyostelium purpureum]